MGEQKSYGLWSNWKCMLACLLVSMSPFQYGVDFGLIGGMQAMIGFLKIFGYVDPATPIGYNISPGVQQLISSLMTLGAFLGSFIAGPMAIKLGRKPCLWTACVLCAASDAIMMGTTKLAGLYVGRLFIGIANGFFMTFSQLYLQEVAPARYRGLALAMFQIWTSVGSLIGTIVDNFTSKIMSRASYMIPLSLIYIVPAFIATGLFFIPESPRYLVYRGNIEQARKSLQWLRPNKDAIEAELAEMQIAINAEKEHVQGAPWVDMWRNPVDRRRTLLSIGAIGVQAACGVMFMLAYGTYFFEMADVGHPFENSVILTAIGVIAIIIMMLLISSYGRRRIFLTFGLVFCAFCQLIIAVVYTKSPGTTSTGKIIVAFSVLYVFIYNSCICPYSWLLGGEIPSQRLRSYTFGMATGISFLGAWLATFTAPYFINPSALNWGPKYGYIWFPSGLLAAAFVYFYIPEVKDRSLEEIDEMFEARVPAKKFRGYKCMIKEQAHKSTLVEDDALAINEKPVMDATVQMIENIAHKHHH